MARDDDGGRGKPKGTLAIDIRDMDLDGEDPPPKSSKGRSSERGSSREYGRSRSDGPQKGGDSGGRRRPTGGFGDSGGGGKGTLAVDLSSLDLDDDEGRGSSQSSRPGRSGAAWGGDDPPARDRSSSKGSQSSGRSSSQSRGRAPGGRQVEEWDDDHDDHDDPIRNYEADKTSQPTRPSTGITDEDIARALPSKSRDPDATSSINLADAPAEPRQASARLTFRTGQAAEPVHTFDKDVIRVGREVDNDIVLLDAQSSRYHFELRRRGSSFELKDLDSGNGSFVNGHRVKRVTLTEGAILRVGDTELVFELIQPGVAGPRGGLSSKGTEVAEALPAPEAAPAVSDGGEDVDTSTDDDEPPKIPGGVIAAMASVGLLAFVFVSLLLVFLLTGDGDRPAKGTRTASSASAAADRGEDDEQELPPGVLVGPALSRADKAYGAGDWMTARGHVQVVLTVDPGNKRAKQFLGRVDRALQTEDSSALRVTFDPTTAKRGKPLAIRLRLELPPRELRATFMGKPVELTLSPDVPREYVGEVLLPKKMKKGEQELDVEITDFLEERFRFARRVNVR